MKSLKKHFMPVRTRQGRASKGAPLGLGRWGFMAPELAQFIYAAITAVVILFMDRAGESTSTALAACHYAQRYRGTMVCL